MTVDPVAFNIGPAQVRWYGILMAVAVLIGTSLARKESMRKGIDPEKILNMVIIIAPLSWLGARIYYVAFNWPVYRNDPAEIFKIWHGGLAIHGGLITAVILGYFYTRRNHLNFWEVGDLIAPSFILGQAIGRWGNFFNQEAYGYATNLPWAMYIGGAYRHPTFLYESLWDFGVFLFLMWYRRKNKTIAGNVLLTYLFLYSVGRFIVEGFRTDSLMLGPLRAAQVASLLIMIVSSLIFIFRNLGLGNKFYKK
ncbi:MAG: prolipoprotein diacylglyceryl transferase [Eubacteriales bacterium]